MDEKLCGSNDSLKGNICRMNKLFCIHSHRNVCPYCSRGGELVTLHNNNNNNIIIITIIIIIIIK